MSNHVHLIAVPRRAEALARAVGRVHQRHARRVQAPRGETGHLWANQFYSTALDDAHLWTAIRYVELNPVRAGLVVRAEDWAWSSARAHGGPDPGGAGAPLLDPARPFGGCRPHPLTGAPLGWAEWLALGLEESQEAEATDRLRRATMTGRPCGSEDFMKRMEQQLGRSFERRKPGPRPRDSATEGNGQYELFSLNELQIG